MRRKATRTSAVKQREQQPIPTSVPTPQPTRPSGAKSPSQPPPGASWQRWCGRLLLMVLVPAALLGILELGLRLFGYGYPTSFFLKMDDGRNYTANRSFGWQFFPRETATSPHPFLMPVKKQPGTIRLFILGESAAQGTPAPPFGFGRILEVMLRERFPQQHFEIVNAAMRGIDSNIILPIARECVQHEPDLFLVYMGNNEAIGLYSPDPNSHNFVGRRWLLRTGQKIKATKLYQLAESVFRKIRKQPASKPQDMEFFRKQYFAADAPGREITYDTFHANLDEICGLTLRSGARVLVSTVGANLKDFPPLGSLHRSGLPDTDKSRWESAFTAGIAAEAASHHEQALTNYLDAARLDDHFAELQFRLGRCYLAAGQFEKAQEHYLLSRDWDALQFRSDSRLNRSIREIAASKQAQGLRLVDGERAFAESPLSEHHIPGNSLFNDHVHMSFDGDYLLAQTFFPAVVSALGLTNATAPLPSRAECAERLGFTSWEEVNVALGMLHSLDKPPFLDQLDHKEQQARTNQILQQRLSALNQKEQQAQAAAVYRAALARNPSDWQLHYIYGNFLTDLQDYNGAVEEYKWIVSTFPKLQPMRIALANALAGAGRAREALDQLSEILAFDPDCAPAKAAIAQIQANSSPFRRPPGR